MAGRGEEFAAADVVVDGEAASELAAKHLDGEEVISGEGLVESDGGLGVPDVDEPGRQDNVDIGIIILHFDTEDSHNRQVADSYIDIQEEPVATTDVDIVRVRGVS